MSTAELLDLFAVGQRQMDELEGVDLVDLLADAYRDEDADRGER